LESLIADESEIYKVKEGANVPDDVTYIAWMSQETTRIIAETLSEHF